MPKPKRQKVEWCDVEKHLLEVIDELRGKIEDMEHEIDELRECVDTHNGEISTLQDDVEKVRWHVDELVD